MVKKIRWILFATLAIGVGLYPILYFLTDSKVGILNSKSEALLANAIWNIGFYTHITFGGLALFIGWTQFSAKIRKKYLNWHRALGKLYVLFVMLSSTAAIGIGFFATGGWVAASGCSNRYDAALKIRVSAIQSECLQLAKTECSGKKPLNLPIVAGFSLPSAAPYLMHLCGSNCTAPSLLSRSLRVLPYR